METLNRRILNIPPRQRLNMTYVYFRGAELYLDPAFAESEGIEDGYVFKSQSELFAVLNRQDEFRKRG